jgi:hypothetical protein
MTNNMGWTEYNTLDPRNPGQMPGLPFRRNRAGEPSCMHLDAAQDLVSKQKLTDMA